MQAPTILTGMTPERSEEKYKALDRKGKGFGTHGVFSSVLPVKGKTPERDHCIMEINV